MTEWVNLLELEGLAEQRLPRVAFDYYAGGAEDEVTLRENRAAFERIALRPHMLVDVSSVDTSATALGQRVAAPILVAPTAMQRLGHPEGELATARGAGAAETLMVVSTLATTSLEDVAAAASGPLWFQLYAYKDRGITRALVERARTAGYQALCLTADAAHAGRRERDLRSHFALPPGVTLGNFSGSDMGLMPQQDSGSALTTYIMKLIDPAFTWNDVAWLQSIAGMPLLLKGILVSNHGGRQLDGAVAGIRALPEVVAAVEGRAEVYVDGGVRRGTDVLKALALGARAVLIGRPILWGLALDGADGVQRVLEMLRHELAEAMLLAGRPTIASIDRSLVSLPT